MARNNNASPVKVIKENLYMRVIIDGEPAFIDVTSHVGKESPYKTKVRTTVGYRVSDEIVSFSVMQVTKQGAKKMFNSRDLQIPRGTLSSLEERALKLTKDESFGKDEVIMEMEGVDYRFNWSVDDAGILSLEPQFDEEPFELPIRPLRFNLFLRSPKAERVLAISFSGYIDRKPGEAETPTRAALKAVNNLSGLSNFRILSGVETVELPSPPSGAPVAPVRSADDQVVFTIPLRLYDDAASELVGQGSVDVEIDLDHANASTGKLLYHLSPSEDLEMVIGVYKNNLLDAIATVMRDLVDDQEQRDLTYDIVLGQVAKGSIEMLQEQTKKFPALDLTPTQYRALGANEQQL